MGYLSGTGATARPVHRYKLQSLSGCTFLNYSRARSLLSVLASIPIAVWFDLAKDSDMIILTLSI